MKTCRHCVDFFADYLEGALPPDEARALDDHFARCSPCLTLLQTYRATPKVCRAALEQEMPEELAESLEKFLSERIPRYKI